MAEAVAQFCFLSWGVAAPLDGLELLQGLAFFAKFLYIPVLDMRQETWGKSNLFRLSLTLESILFLSQH